LATSHVSFALSKGLRPLNCTAQGYERYVLGSNATAGRADMEDALVRHSRIFVSLLCFPERLDLCAPVRGQLMLTAVHPVSGSLFVDDDGRSFYS
jgi:hypothetical protein